VPLVWLAHLEDLAKRSQAPSSHTGVPVRTRRPATSSLRHYRLAPIPDEAAGFAQPRASSSRLPTPSPQSPAAGLLDTLHRWGVTTLGELAALPAAEITSRFGELGRRWHERAHGGDSQPLVDDPQERRFEATLDLEWPVEGLEPLSFVLARLLEPLCAVLSREERGAALVHTRLDLVTRVAHRRTLQLPAPMNDAKVLRTLILLDLEANPPDAAIDRVSVLLEPVPGRRVQFALFRRPLPAPDQIATLVARLGALMGVGRCGTPELLDTHRPGAFGMKPFAPRESAARMPRPASPSPASTRHDQQPSSLRDAGPPQALLRRFRRPVRIRMALHDGRPVRLVADDSVVKGGKVVDCAGPWRTSGEWWWPRQPLGPRGRPWSRDEWDVAISGGPVYRVSRIHADDRWVVEGIWD
jgi:protein ImuB